MGNELTIKKNDEIALITETRLGELLKPLTSEILLFDTYVAGTSYVKDESVFETLKEGDKLVLLREPNNKFDENAILVLDAQKRKLGYIPEKHNTVFARLMDAGKCLTARVKTYIPEGYLKQVRINIYLVDF